ncbi:hypothetical protein [Streptomyces sp. Amel2xC10]|uniref:hypothetical protein n=1 Tax=Streptomyces sp. Amel2xC10 TaxID=1305826 RepID=UPI000A08AB71|nr:hypothetical protein [Streptomyces sp. Amel2xC10]SMF86396.1 hypothetical protein SAMN02745830_07164 [Streptomyces sp. Amel2xC10]
MGYRPHPDVDRALRQVRRGRLRNRQHAWIDEAFADLKLTPWQRAFLNRTLTWPKHAGKSAITAAIADQAVKAGQHVHVAGRDGVRCHGGDNARGPRLADDAEVTGE